MARKVKEIRAVYDGKVFVPKEKVDIPENTEVSVNLHLATPSVEQGSLEALNRFAGSIDAPWYDPSKFSREEIYD